MNTSFAYITIAVTVSLVAANYLFIDVKKWKEKCGLDLMSFKTMHYPHYMI